ncbi:hypothetical protein Tco_0814685 [Tanacetum coccineum]
MDSDKYLEGQSMQRPPLFESDSFIYWKNRFETYVKSKDLDLWHVITNGDFQPIIQNPETKLDEVVPFEKQTDDLKRRLAKNNEAKMVIYNALPRKEYERIFMCNTAKEIWKTLLITHQGRFNFRGTSLIGFLAQSVGSSNAVALDSSYLLVLITGASQSRQHVDTSLIHIESRKPPTKSLFDVGSRRISIVTVNTKEYHSNVLAGVNCCLFNINDLRMRKPIATC